MADKLQTYILSALAVLIVLTVHEFSHAYAAYKLGDPTARNMGRLTLNPLKHLDPIGALFMLFFHFGWAKPVPINARNFKNPKKGFAISALAGPLVNIILAFVTSFIYILLFDAFSGIFPSVSSGFLRSVMINTLDFFYLFHAINLGIGIFNLIPIPPLDGSRILYVVLPPKYYFGVMKYERKIYIGFIAWLLLGDVVKSLLLSIPFVAINPVLSVIAHIFSLSDLLGALLTIISNGMMKLWLLLPFINL